jgi:hypothetical protein
MCLGFEEMQLSHDVDFFNLLVGSYFRILGTAPIFIEPGRPHTALHLYQDAAYCVVAHNTDADPRFVYANMAAQACFEYNWDEFTSLPSRLSAEAPNRDERQRLLDSVALTGFATSYKGVRIAKSGRRFWIEDGIVWQLIDESGNVKGQAATFGSWRDARIAAAD